MSRRTRTRIRRSYDSYGLGTNHHNQYASSTSYFPKSYSLIGKQIKFPSTAVAFLSEGKLTYYGEFEKFIEKLQLLSLQQLNQIHTANIGIKGMIVQNINPINNVFFAFSMIICLISKIFESSCFRAKFFTQYKEQTFMYKEMAGKLAKMSNLQNLMFTFQDNQLNSQKVALLNHYFSRLKLKSLTIRNLTYFIQNETTKKLFKKQNNPLQKIIEQKIQLTIVWEKNSVKFNSKNQLQEQKQSIVASISDQI